MPDKEINDALKNKINELAQYIKDTTPGKFDPGALMQLLKLVGEGMNIHNLDLSIIYEHLEHISKTTESGVLTVINTAEAMMEDTSNAMGDLEKLEAKCSENKDLKQSLEKVNETIDSVQNNCFTIITALEFEDINRQLLERILVRLHQIQENQEQILELMELKEPLDKKDSAFLEHLKHIIDLEGARRQSQEEIDELFESFDL